MNNHYKTTYDGYLTDVKTRGIGDQVTYKAKDHTVVGGLIGVKIKWLTWAA